jgi:hypothetical protein
MSLTAIFVLNNTAHMGAWIPGIGRTKSSLLRNQTKDKHCTEHVIAKEGITCWHRTHPGLDPPVDVYRSY